MTYILSLISYDKSIDHFEKEVFLWKAMNLYLISIKNEQFFL
jgi:hypothetical protein